MINEIACYCPFKDSACHQEKCRAWIEKTNLIDGSELQLYECSFVVHNEEAIKRLIQQHFNEAEKK